MAVSGNLKRAVQLAYALAKSSRFVNMTREQQRALSTFYFVHILAISRAESKKLSQHLCVRRFRYCAWLREPVAKPKIGNKT